ncbi:MAG TPA: hypothetical protein PK509_05880 [Catalimonadaceae bacterium]|nr:hypothetical protein [Catalimonadaceae bacterium]HPI09498.1 hypothetical protein [Catalimonadaceae bacterium]
MENIPLRRQLGFTQENFAIYLNVSKSLVALFETGKRSLSAAASQRYVSLFNNWKEFEKNWIQSPSKPIPTEQVSEAREFLEKEVFRLRNERDKEIIRQNKSAQPEMDYPKVQAFLQQEFEKAELGNEQHILKGVILLNVAKQAEVSGSLVNNLQKSLQARFLDFQISEYQKELDQLGKQSDSPG